MYCPKCGKEIPDNSKYCGVCGAKIEQIDSEKNVKNGGEGGIRTHGPFRSHRFSRPAP